MGKNILVLTGSPRIGGNSDKMADAFLEGAQEKGHTVTKFAAAGKHISGCLACDTCWSRGQACSIEDDFQQLSPLLEAADVLVFAFPLYWSSMPAQLKAAVDRFYAWSPTCPRPLHIKESVLLICGEGEYPKDFTEAIHMYSGMAAYLGWAERGILAVPKVHKKGEIAETTALEEARALGRGI